MNYGFKCDCRFCRFQSGIHSVDAPPERGSDALRTLEVTLRAFALGVDAQSMRVPTAPRTFESMPAILQPVFHETYLPALSELFSKTSHEGPYVDAVEAGLTLLALYVVVYPPQYPQIGERSLVLLLLWISDANMTLR